MSSELDRLSCLPSEVTEKILLLLSTRDAVRTSGLSIKWRYRWAMLPCLVFDENCMSLGAKNTKIVKIVDHALLLHIGPLHKVVLDHRNLRTNHDIDRWILHLSRVSIREFIFNFSQKHPYRSYQLPSSFFSFQDMIILELKNCLLKLPSTFMGYPNLENLTLQDVTLSQDVVERLIVGCPLLKFLHLYNCGKFACLKVDAPKLQVSYFDVVFENLCLEHTLNLKDVTISLKEFYVRLGRSRTSSNLVKFLVQLPHIEILHIHGYFLKYLAFGSCPPLLPQPCLYLHTLDLHISFSQQSAIISVLCILRNSPALRDLRILADEDEDEDKPVLVGEVYPWLHDGETQFRKLRIVRFNKLADIQGGLDFIRLLLLRSPVLEKMTISPRDDCNSSKLLTKLIKFKRASADAEIIYLEK